MTFKDSVGVSEELKVEMVDCTISPFISVERSWFLHLMHELILLRNPLQERPKLEELIEEARQMLTK